MSLLTIVQSVARQVAVDVPTVVVGSTDTNTQSLYSCAIWAARHIWKAHEWRSLTKEYTFATLPNVAEYALPSDFDRLAMDSAWSRTDFERLRGALSPQDWQLLKSGNITVTTTVRSFRLKPVATVMKVFLDPTPTTAVNLVYEYVSRNWCKSGGGAEQADWAADTDEPIIDPYLVELGTLARMLRRLGMDYSEEMAEFESRLDLAKASDGGGAKTVSIVPREYGLLPEPNIPEGSW
jgi:hypothetical protein